jgi:hypothetical protein
MSSSMRRLTGPRMGRWFVEEEECVARDVGGIMQPSAMPVLDEKCECGVAWL